MDFTTAIKNQTHAALHMLAECVDGCPQDLWLSGEHPRPYWKIAYHVTMYSQCFLNPSFDSWQRWEHHRREAERAPAARRACRESRGVLDVRAAILSRHGVLCIEYSE